MNLLTFDLNLLRVLDAILDTGSTVAAADRVGLSQPAVSAALKRLRDSLDDPLFVRQGQRLEPTEFAKSIAIPLRRHLDGLNELLNESRVFDPQTASRTFVISGTDYFSIALMPKLADFFMRNAPGLTVTMIDINNHNYVDSLLERDSDVALLPTTDFPEWAESAPLTSVHLALAARKDHPRLARAGVAPGTVIPLDLLCDLGFVFMSPEGKLAGNMDAILQGMGRQRRVVMALPFFSGVRHAVEASDLVALLPEDYVQMIGSAVELSLYRLPFRLPDVGLSMVWHKRKTSDPGHRWLREKISEIMRGDT